MAASNPALRAPSPLARPRSNGPSLSKSRFTTGLQCHRLLWWTVNEPDAPELVTSPEQQAIFDQGTAVGEVARAYVSGGELIDLPYWDKLGRVAATREAIEAGRRSTRRGLPPRPRSPLEVTGWHLKKATLSSGW
jgi:hypothetical protein